MISANLLVIFIQLVIPLCFRYTLYRLFKVITLVRFGFAKGCYFLAGLISFLAVCFVYLYAYTQSGTGSFGEGLALGFMLLATFGASALLIVVGGIYHLYCTFSEKKPA